jgi:AmmeMemoRadiSam system protein A
VGKPSLENCKILANALVDIYHEKPEAIFILSSDLSHYHSAKIAEKKDTLALETIADLDIEKFMELHNAGTIELCGSGPVLSFMLASPFLGVNDSEILSYSHSGKSAPEMEKVVGYGAVAFISSKIELSEIEKKDLLMIARETIKVYLKDKKIPKFRREDPSYASRRGAFVTLTKEGRLRGCIGYIYPFQPLLPAVQEMAVAAAVKDRRFPPLEPEELKECEIEISILSNLYPLEKLGVLEIGRDGLYIRYKGKTGILLPQVAEELNLTKEEFLEQVSLKAGLPKDTWKHKDSQLFYFSVEKFKEN